jgi:uncharacterized membrane protein HdeD (DUF308 family)
MANPAMTDPAIADLGVGVLSRNWGWMLLRGVAALVFGLLTLFYPGITVVVLVLFFGAYALVDGIFAVVAAVANRQTERHWVALLISGLLSILVGLAAFFMPGVTTVVLLYFIAAWAIVTGIGNIVTAVRLRKVMRGEWLLILAGVLSVLFGLAIAAFPGAGAIAIALWIGAYAIVLGVVVIAFALRLRSWRKAHGVDERLRTA